MCQAQEQDSHGPDSCAVNSLAKKHINKQTKRSQRVINGTQRKHSLWDRKDMGATFSTETQSDSPRET